jgi:hypothetical protein
MSITKEEITRIEKLREVVLNQIKKNPEEAKPYEGTISIIFPGYFDDEWGLKLSSYLIVPARSKIWYGKTLLEAIEDAEKDIEIWIMEMNAEEVGDVYEIEFNEKSERIRKL